MPVYEVTITQKSQIIVQSDDRNEARKFVRDSWEFIDMGTRTIRCRRVDAFDSEADGEAGEGR